MISKSSTAQAPAVPFFPPLPTPFFLLPPVVPPPEVGAGQVLVIGMIEPSVQTCVMAIGVGQILVERITLPSGHVWVVFVAVAVPSSS